MSECCDRNSEEILKLITVSKLVAIFIFKRFSLFKEKVKKVATFRDDYLLNHPIEEAKLKEDRVRKLVEATLNELKEYESKNTDYFF